MTTQRTKWITYARDAILFALGVAIILKQSGILFPPPEAVELELLALGALFCNGPLFLQYLSARRGTSGSQLPEEQSASDSPRA